MMEIDASRGGSVVRAAIGLTAATGTDVRVVNVRADRPDPGLKHQHLAGLRAVADLCGADVTGDTVGSRTVGFEPGAVEGGSVRAEVETAGAVGLVLQPLVLAACGTGETVAVTVDGGATAGKWAPPVPYLERITAPLLARFGIDLSLDVRRHGFYPEGGALVHAEIDAEPSRAEMLDPVEADRVEGVSLASGHLADAEVAERQRKAARTELKDAYPSLDIDIAVETVDSRSPGSAIVLSAGPGLGGDGIGEKGVRAELVGKGAAEALIADLPGPLDRHASDQVLPVLALAGGAARVRFTDHVEALLPLVREFADVKVDREEQVVRVS